MSQPTIYDMIRELKGMIYDNQRINSAHMEELEKRILLLENDRQANQIMVMSCSNYLQHIDKMYAENLEKTPLLTPETEQQPPADYGLMELNKLMVAKFGKGIKRDDYLFPLLRNDFIGYTINKNDSAKSYYPLKLGADAGWISNKEGAVRITQKGLEEIISYLTSKGWQEVEA